MSKFLADIRREVEIRVDGYKREKESLAKAAERVVELDELIAEAETELTSISARLPKEEKKDADTDNRP